MTFSRRTTLKVIGIASGVGLSSGVALASGDDTTDECDKPSKDDKPMDDDRPVDEPADAGVRVAHFSPDAPAVDILVDGAEVLSDVPYGAISPYLELDPGTYTITITAAGDPDTVAFEGDVDVGDAYYTVAAIGELEAETFRPEVLTDADPLPTDAPAESAFARVAHFSPDAPAVDIYADDDPLVEDVSFGDVSEYLAVPAGAYELSVRPAGDPETVVASFDVELDADVAYTGYAIGYLEPAADVTDRDFTVEIAVDGPDADEEMPAEREADAVDEEDDVDDTAEPDEPAEEPVADPDADAEADDATVDEPGEADAGA
ncbi:DUF4397 family protein [Natrialba magadii ATCC 43099]|uniref:DUF4397 family protein n=1 Tax=Natrialba magadii (strain ATCC 43099 / DSM 3394 / CCM 3739 / CIP 104546 / IAM 13178 / JCM 8861 / NBRC 102185 / NCIMB 2190 / MS3) TaxID=547559 RepID=D3SVN0_NATMM|nr:DUF4397 domain-containing protein [Natrialba magadii]ADD05638.1 DUF4397 family protein [Natrialba magadii ATCC 43099]ELY29949.1 hypothetical protein C500_10074 [Natrialba magadii ATCC 43099]